MKSNDIKVGEWYFIKYLPSPKSKRQFVGAAKCVGKGSLLVDTPGLFQFYSPLNDSEDGMVQMIFHARDVKFKTDALPTYAALYETFLNTTQTI